MEELTEELVLLAVELINEFGAELEYTFTETGEYNPATSSALPDVVNSQNLKGLVEDYSLQNSGQGFANGLIREGDKKFLLAAGSGVEPETGGNIIFNGSIYSVMNLKEYYAANTVVLYEAQGRS